MEKLKVFLDSNVIFSAAYSEKGKSRSYLFFELQNLNIIKIYISNLVKFESIHNIKIKKPEKLDFLNELLSKADYICSAYIIKSFQIFPFFQKRKSFKSKS